MSAPIQELKLNLQVAIQKAARKSVKKRYKKYLQSYTPTVDLDPLFWEPDLQKVSEDVWDSREVAGALDAFVKRDSELRLDQVKEEVERKLEEQRIEQEKR